MADSEEEQTTAQQHQDTSSWKDGVDDELLMIWTTEGVMELDMEVLASTGFTSVKLFGNCADEIQEFVSFIKEEIVPDDGKGKMMRIAALKGAWKIATAVSKAKTIQEVKDLTGADPTSPVTQVADPAKSGSDKKGKRVTVDVYKAMVASLVKKYGREPPERVRPSMNLLEKVMEIKVDKIFKVIPVREIKSWLDQVTTDATKDIEARTKKFEFCSESGDFQEIDGEKQVSFSPYFLESRIEILSYAMEMVGLGNKSTWEIHREKILDLGKRFMKRGYEILVAESIVRAKIGAFYGSNGGDIDAAIKQVYSSGEAADVWKDKVIDIDPEQTYSQKRKLDQVKKDPKRQNLGKGNFNNGGRWHAPGGGYQQNWNFGGGYQQAATWFPGGKQGGFKGDGAGKGGKGDARPVKWWDEASKSKICWAFHLSTCNRCEEGSCNFSKVCPKVGCGENHKLSVAHPELVSQAKGKGGKKGN